MPARNAPAGRDQYKTKKSITYQFSVESYFQMRVIGEIPNPHCKITIFHWNNRYLIKLEQGAFEQTFKIQEFDLSSEADIPLVITDEFIQAALQRFEGMAHSLHEAMDKI
jgi:hypothetical protein